MTGKDFVHCASRPDVEAEAVNESIEVAPFFQRDHDKQRCAEVVKRGQKIIGEGASKDSCM